MACAESSWDKHWDGGKRCVAGKWRKSWLRQTSDRNLQKNMNNDTFFPVHPRDMGAHGARTICRNWHRRASTATVSTLWHIAVQTINKKDFIFDYLSAG